jgi:hypothetical protein
MCVYQAAGEANDSDGIIGTLCGIKQVIQECLVLVMGKQIKLIQQEYNTLINATS